MAPTLASLTDPRKQAAIERDVDEALREEMETGVRHQGRVTANFLALMAFGGAVAAAGLVTEDPERRTIALVAGAATAFALLRLLGDAAAPADVPVPVPPAVAVPDSGPLRRTPTTPMSVGAGRTWRFQKSRLRFGPRLR